MPKFLLILVCFAVFGCDQRTSNRVTYASQYDERYTRAEQARQDVYARHGADSDGTNAEPSTVDAEDVEDEGNYFCTDDCSGHEAGFNWARENDLEDDTDCDGKSTSFNEGCEAFVAQRQADADALVESRADAAETEDVDDFSYSY